MQRVFHSIFTGRMLLHLRGAVVRDTRGAPTGATQPNLTTILFTPSHGGELSTAIFGVETWFSDGGPDTSDDIELN